MRKFIFGVATLAVALLAFSSCRQKDNPGISGPLQITDPIEAKIPEKITLTLSNGHLHGEKSFHFVPSGGVFKYQDIYNAQTFTFVREGDVWKLDPQSLQRFIGYQTFFYDTSIPYSAKPEYGAILRLYDSAGQLINNDYASERVRGSYQFFSSLSDGKDWDGKAIATTDATQTSLLNYVYCDTNVWDKSASKSPLGPDGKKLYKFLPRTEPIGIKGYYQFLQLGEYTLNIDLWYTPAGKLEGGEPSPFYQPNSTVKKGKRLLRLQLPVSIFAAPTFYDEVIGAIDSDFSARIAAAQSDEEREKLQRLPISWEKTAANLRPIAERLIRLLKADSWESVQADFIQYYTNTGNEGTDEGYF